MLELWHFTAIKTLWLWWGMKTTNYWCSAAGHCSPPESVSTSQPWTMFKQRCSDLKWFLAESCCGFQKAGSRRRFQHVSTSGLSCSAVTCCVHAHLISFPDELYFLELPFFDPVMLKVGSIALIWTISTLKCQLSWNILFAKVGQGV